MPDSPPPIQFPLPKKPFIGGVDTTASSDLLARLNSFLPQLENANKELDKAKEEGKLSEKIFDDADEDDEGGYIEMNLSLGVLEEKKGKKRTLDEVQVRESSDEESDSDEDSSFEEEEDDEEEQETDIMDKLLGAQEKAPKPSIQVVENTVTKDEDSKMEEARKEEG